MPKTIIKIKTWGCSCGYHQDFEPTQENQDKNFNSDKNFRIFDLKEHQCPSCVLKKQSGNLIQETNPDKKITITIMGEEDIETEIEQIKERKVKGEDKDDPDISTPAKENVHRAKRKKDIAEAILEAKKFEDK